MTIMGGNVISVGLEEAGDRVDSFLARKTGITRSQIKGLIEEGHVLVNSKAVSSHYRIKALDRIALMVPEQEPGSLIPEAIPLSVLHVDDHLVVVDKPAGMVVYPAAGHGRGTLMNALAFHCSRLASVGGPLRPGVVHRLDKETSGVMVVALDDGAYYSLVEQFRQRTINRRYITLVWGDLKGSGVISSPIGRSESDRKKMSTKTRRGKEAVTRWKALKRYGVATLLEVKLGTGRTHQIRVHFSSIGHPVIGDRTYGRKTELSLCRRKIPVPRQMLHAELLGFTHPATGEYVEFSIQAPEDMRRVLSEIEGATG